MVTRYLSTINAKMRYCLVLQQRWYFLSCLTFRAMTCSVLFCRVRKLDTLVLSCSVQDDAGGRLIPFSSKADVVRARQVKSHSNHDSLRINVLLECFRSNEVKKIGVMTLRLDQGKIEDYMQF